jgi:hypothetical protein
LVDRSSFLFVGIRRKKADVAATRSPALACSWWHTTAFIQEQTTVGEERPKGSRKYIYTIMMMMMK